MKILLFLNNDIHSSTALNLLFQNLLNHQVKIILSEKIGDIRHLPEELVRMKNDEQEKMKQVFAKLDQNKTYQSEKFKTFDQIAKIFASEIVTYQNVNSEIALQDFRKFTPDLAISIRFGQIFKQALIDIPRYGIINLHSGILPNYRGIMPSFWAILNGAKTLGSSLHYIKDQTIDRGDVISFSKSEIDWNSSLIFNINKAHETSFIMVAEAIEKFSRGEKPQGKKQSELGEAQYFSYPRAEDIKKFVSLMPLTKEDDVARILQKW